MRHVLIPTMFSVVLAACGGGSGGGDTASTSVSLTGTAGKGRLIHATVTGYELINGVRSTTAWATATTNNVGAYALMGEPTTNPILIVVTSNADTEMLDETKPQNDGTFRAVPVKNISLRSFVDKLTASTEVKVNALTESAVAMAEQTKDAGGNKVGLTLAALKASKQLMKNTFVGTGVDPFKDELVPANADDLNDAKIQSSIGLMMGLVSSATAACDLQCQVVKLTESVDITVDNDGVAGLTAAAKTALATRKAAIVTEGEKAAKNSEFENAISQYKPAIKTALQASLFQQATTASTEQVSAEQDEKDGVEPSKTLSLAKATALEGVDGFVATLRDGFKTAEGKFKEAQDSLSTTYKNVTFQGLNQLASILSGTVEDCADAENNTFDCGQVSAVQTWEKANGGWQTSYMTKDGYTVSVQAAGAMTQTTAQFNISGVVKSGSKTLVEFTDIAVSGTVTVDANQNIVKGTFTPSGSVKAYDTTGADAHATLGLSNASFTVDASTSTRLATVDIGALTLTLSNGDTLSGSASIEVKEVDAKSGYCGYYGCTKTVVPTKGSLVLKGVHTNQELLSLVASASSTPADLTKNISETNFEKYAGKLAVTAVGGTVVTFEESKNTWGKVNQTVTIENGTNTLSMSMTPETAQTASGWCLQDFDMGLMCATTASIVANGGKYTAEMSKTTGKASGDLYEGTAATGTKIGVLTEDGVIQIDGKEYSLY